MKNVNVNFFFSTLDTLDVKQVVTSGETPNKRYRHTQFVYENNIIGK